ncbi:hypothetical protein ACHAXT_006628 [Thalassiosira profunda]
MAAYHPPYSWRRAALLTVLVATALLSLRSVDNDVPSGGFRRMLLGDGLGSGEDATVLAIPGEGVPAPNGASEEDVEANTNAASPHSHLIADEQPLPRYTLQDAVASSHLYDHTFALLVYDPADDVFRGLYSTRHHWVSGCDKLLASVRHTAFFLRKLFPERFCGSECDELVMPISSGDYPGVKGRCLDSFRQEASNPLTPSGWQEVVSRGCHSSTAPILHYGSVFRQSQLFPSMLAMPMPDRHNLYCFEMWATHGSVCRQMRPTRPEDPKAELVFGDELGLTWEELIPQVVWRGTDFGYLRKVYPALQRPQITPNAAVVQSLRRQYDSLLPRWKAVVLSAEAEAEAIGLDGEPDQLPWANMKFSSYIKSGSKTRTEGADRYKEFEAAGIATGGYMGRREMATYKYLIDIGGGGGTSWSGTIHKLALPGLLFHHLTPTKDYIHDWMTPWIHYVPISEDLSDLKEKFEWAESHPEESKAIAVEATKLMRYLTSPEGYGEMYHQDIVEPLRRVVEAYQPIKTLPHQTPQQTWKEILLDNGAFVPAIKCSGVSVKTCQQEEKTDLRRAIGRHTRNARKGFEPQSVAWSR